MNYTSKTMEFLRDEWSPSRISIVEKFVMGANVRRDLFEIIDILMIRERRVWGVQSTSWGQRDPHIKKLTVEKLDATLDWLWAGAPLSLITWRKEKVPTKKGKVVERWFPYLDEIVLNQKGDGVVVVELGKQRWERTRS